MNNDNANKDDKRDFIINDPLGMNIFPYRQLASGLFLLLALIPLVMFLFMRQ